MQAIMLAFNILTAVGHKVLQLKWTGALYNRVYAYHLTRTCDLDIAMPCFHWAWYQLVTA